MFGASGPLEVGSLRNDPRRLTPCWPPGRWNAAHALRMAARDMLAMTIAAEGSHGACLRDRKSVTVITHHTPPRASLWLSPLAHNETRGPCGGLLPVWTVPDPLGVEQAATGRLHVFPDGTGELQHRVPHGRGRANTSRRTGGRGGGAQGLAVMARTW